MRSWTPPETLKDKMLVLLYEQSEADLDKPVSKEVLAIEAWRRHPADFGMSQFSEHPNTAAAYSVLSKLYMDGLASMKETSQYGITQRGLHRACRMVEAPIVRRKKEAPVPKQAEEPAQKEGRAPAHVAKHPDFMAILNKYRAPR